jgi:hypothetical protein
MQTPGQKKWRLRITPQDAIVLTGVATGNVTPKRISRSSWCPRTTQEKLELAPTVEAREFTRSNRATCVPVFQKAANRLQTDGFHHRGATFAPKAAMVHGFARSPPLAMVQTRTATACPTPGGGQKKMAPAGAMRKEKEIRVTVR